MKKLILIILSLIIINCEQSTELQTNQDMMSLKWILLERSTDVGFYVENCDAWLDYDSSLFIEKLSDYCFLDEHSTSICGDYRLGKERRLRVNGCDGFDLCKGESAEEVVNNEFWDCCLDSIYYQAAFNQYKLIYVDLDICMNGYLDYNDEHGESCDSLINEYTGSIIDFDIILPEFPTLYLPSSHCEVETYCQGNDHYFFHPNCDELIDTTIVISDKNILIEKMSLFNREQRGFLHYYELDGYLVTDEDNIDVKRPKWKVIDYQNK